LVEYALILALISCVCLVTLRGLGQSIATKLESVNNVLSE
jgi:Flp pilus assembly pilin Flp